MISSKHLNLGDPSIARPCDGIEVGVVFEPSKFDPEAAYVMPIGSIGRHRATGEYCAASDMRFLDYPQLRVRVSAADSAERSP